VTSLAGKVAVVTGASRGVGKGVALGLGEAGTTVYLTGRTLQSGDAAIPLPGTLRETAEAVARAGGKGIVVRCDHTGDLQVEALFRQIQEEQGRLDILVNNAWGGYEYFNDATEFWKEKGFWTVPLSRWDAMFRAGVRAHYVAGVFAAPMMIAQRTGLIVNISSFSAFRNTDGVAYGVAKAADTRMAACMAHELREHHVAVVVLIPGLVRTEAVLKAAEHFDLSNSESPEFIGRAVAALACDPDIMEKTGQWLVAAELAKEYGFADVDGRQPTSLRDELLG
jgi:NAD(P)-dependent dehydrogenase (short-subunit alcohol dehydrogenase family)